MRLAALLYIALLAPSSLVANSTVIPSPLVDFEIYVNMTSNFGFWEAGNSVRTPLESPFSLEVGAFRVEFRFLRTSEIEYSAEIRVSEAEGSNWRELGTEPVTFSGRFGEPARLTHQFPESTLNLTATVNQPMIRIDDEYTGRPKSEAWLAMAALALLLAGSLLFISRVARKRGERI